MARIPPLQRDALSDRGREVYDAIASGPRGKVEGPLNVWLNSPELGQNAQALGAFCRYGTSLPPRLSELAILTVAVFWRSGFEWAVHAPIAVKAGLDAGLVETLRTGGRPDFAREDEAAVHAFASELLAQRRVSDATYARAEAALGPTGLVELVGILGYYGLISLTINAFEVDLPEGAPNPFPEG